MTPDMVTALWTVGGGLVTVAGTAVAGRAQGHRARTDVERARVLADADAYRAGHALAVEAVAELTRRAAKRAELLTSHPPGALARSLRGETGNTMVNVGPVGPINLCCGAYPEHRAGCHEASPPEPGPEPIWPVAWVQVVIIMDRDGVETRRGDVLTDLPWAEAHTWAGQRLVKPLCEGPGHTEWVACTCRWCIYAALTDDDRATLAGAGWQPPRPPGRPAIDHAPPNSGRPRHAVYCPHCDAPTRCTPTAEDGRRWWHTAPDGHDIAVGDGPILFLTCHRAAGRVLLDEDGLTQAETARSLIGKETR